MPLPQPPDPWEQPQNVVDRDGEMRRPTVEEIDKIDKIDKIEVPDEV